MARKLPIVKNDDSIDHSILIDFTETAVLLQLEKYTFKCCSCDQRIRVHAFKKKVCLSCPNCNEKNYINYKDEFLFFSCTDFDINDYIDLDSEDSNLNSENDESNNVDYFENDLKNIDIKYFFARLGLGVDYKKLFYFHSIFSFIVFLSLLFLYQEYTGYSNIAFVHFVVGGIFILIFDTFFVSFFEKKLTVDTIGILNKDYNTKQKMYFLHEMYFNNLKLFKYILYALVFAFSLFMSSM
ncbi:hypothetical protein [Desulfonatronum lacustre]|uniref:hypothetical protein n=1 Tax=Desulfonatronum lacustre TaxID=66849 RepID=UPI0004915F6B|nr:hypothetical protein [Desulfonatronum lacustre]